MESEVSATFAGFNRAADNNKAAILQQLRRNLPATGRVLEIGSGSGQHVVFFAGALPGLTWQPTDRGSAIEMLSANIASISMPNVRSPLCLDVGQFDIADRFDAAYCANVIHIMPESLLPALFAGVADCLGQQGQFFVYGPFRYRGAFTTPSNAQFDEWLKARNRDSGIRDIEAVMATAHDAGLLLVSDTPMPANNQFLVFRRR